MSTRDDDADESLVVDYSEVAYQVQDNLRKYLRGAIDEDRLFARVQPLYEETSEPAAEHVVAIMAGYCLGQIDRAQMRRMFEEIIDNQRQGILH